jgi:GTP-binding protein EngB required for normal cell division
MTIVISHVLRIPKRELPPVQIVLTKCDLVHQADLARRVAMVRQQLSACLVREPSALPITLVSAQVEGQAGVLELQKELASLVHTIPSP